MQQYSYKGGVEHLDAATALRRVRRMLDDANASLMGRNVLALCSGGVDSLVQIALLKQLPHGASPAKITVLWCDHQLQKRSTSNDEKFDGGEEAVRALTMKLELPLVIRRRENCPQFEVSLRKNGLQAAARKWRYQQAEAAALEIGADVVTTGHNASDQLECALLSLLGVSGSGLITTMLQKDYPFVSSKIALIRPLLGLTREDIERVADELNLAWYEDPSNAKTDRFVRNKLRHEVIPQLVAAYPEAGAVIARAGERARERDSALRELIQKLRDDSSQNEALDIRWLQKLSATVRRAVLADWLRGHSEQHDRLVSARLIRSVERLVLLPGRASCSRIELPSKACVLRDGYYLTYHDHT